MPKQSADAIDRQIGANIRLARRAKGLRIVDLCDVLDVEPFSIQRYEAGRSRICASYLYKLAQLLDMPMEWFIEHNVKPVERYNVMTDAREKF